MSKLIGALPKPGKGLCCVGRGLGDLLVYRESLLNFHLHPLPISGLFHPRCCDLEPCSAADLHLIAIHYHSTLLVVLVF